jgi:signal transduction histidine kinase
MSLFTKTLFAPKTAAHSQSNGAHPPALASIVMPRRGADLRAGEIAMISHELRNSLGVVRNAARLLRAPVKEDGIDGARVLIERHVGQMSRHIEELLDASQDEHLKALRLSHLDLRTVVEFAVDATAPAMVLHKHHLVVSLPSEPLWVHADAARLEQVFSNLLINAAKYTPDGGEIALTLERVDAHASIRLCDSGIGISAAMLERVFQLFSQVDAQDARAEGGRGIGLAVVRELVEAHGGSVQATSAGLGRGSQFTVMLPAFRAQADIQPPESSVR